MEKLKQYSETECALAATVFTDIHHGTAISEEEFDYRKKLEEDYKEEINEAKVIISTHPTFNNLPYEDKIIFCIELLRKLRIKNNKDSKIQIQESAKKITNFYELNEQLRNIPQEPYEPIDKNIKHK